MNTVDPIQETLKLYQNFYDEVVEKRKTVALIVINDISGDLVVSLAEKFVTLLSYSLDQFGNEPCTTEDLINLQALGREEITLDDLNKIPKGVIPMFLVRTIIKFDNLKIFFGMQKIKPVFQRFVDRYGPIIPK